MALVEIGPEEGEQGVAPVEAAGSVGGEVGEESESFRLPQHGRRLASVRGPQVHHAEGVKLDHDGRER